MAKAEKKTEKVLLEEAPQEEKLDVLDFDREEFISSDGSVEFKCPSCSKGKISRTFKERRLGTRYKCDKCGFEGPN